MSGDYGTEAIAELTTQQAALEGRRTPNSRIIYTGGTQGPRGSISSPSIRIKGVVATTGDLPDGTPGEPRADGDMYMVSADNHIYVFNATANAWQDAGELSLGIQSPDGSIATAVALTLAEFDAIPVKDPLRVYIIKQGI